jgi:hypothetical protein
VGAAFMGRGAVIGLIAAMVIGAVLLVVILCVFWPTALEPSTQGSAELPARKEVHLLGIAEFKLSTEVLFFIIVAAAGALGGFIHCLRSLAKYVGNRQLRWSWAAFYILLPLIGALGGIVFYVVLRAGLFSPSTSIDQASPFGFAAVAALVGLFSEQAMEKLRQIAGNVFTDAEPQTDPLDPGN